MWPCGECRCDESGRGGDKWHIPRVIETTTLCARKMVTPFTWYLLMLHKHYLHGNLALPGGVTDQPGMYLDAMEIISEWVNHGKSGNS